MICKKCGKENQEDAVFCQYCGEKNLEEAVMVVDGPLYNTISLWKVFVLMVLSFGLYSLVWAYNLWKQGQKEYDKKISPFWRAWFFPFTSFRMFLLINKYIEKSDIKPFNPECYAFLYFLASLFVNASLGLTEIFIKIPIILSVQSKINKFNYKYNIPAKNDKWTWKTTITIVLCFVILLIINLLSLVVSS